MEGEVQMNELLKKDIIMKAISVLIAVILWFMVLDQSNPYEPKDIYVTLNILNRDTLAEKNIILKNEDTFPKTVLVKLQGRRDKLKNLNQSDFRASLDLSKINDANTKSLRIDGPFYVRNGKSNTKDITDVTYSSAYPSDVPLELDSKGENVFQVEVKSSGKPKDNYKIISIASSPEKIQLEGTDSLLKTVGTIKVNVDVTNLDRDLESKLKCIIFDKNNKDITKSFKTLSVNIKINVAKEVVVKPIIAGTPAPNFLNVSNVSSPKTVLISGPYEIVSKIKQLVTVPISIENQNENAIITSELVLPEGVTLVNAPQEVTVSLAIEPLAQKTFVFSMEDILVLNPEIDNSLKYDILTPNLSIEIKGPKYELDKLNLAAIMPSIDVSKLIEGISKVPLKFTLPSTVRLVKDYDVELSIVKR